MISIQKRSAVSLRQKLPKQAVAILAALVVGALVILLFGHNPLAVYKEILSGALGSRYSRAQTIETLVPLLIMALGVTICYKIKFISIGTEGQLYIGAMFATYIALHLKGLPGPILLPLMLLASVLGGGLWCLLPAFLKVKFDTNETLVTLMLNYVAIKFITYLQYGPWKDPNVIGYPVIPQFTKNAILPDVLGIHAGWIIALALLVLTTVMLYRTKLGYKITVLGENPATARYAGFGTMKLTLLATFLGGGLCGIAGFIQASAIENSLTASISGNLGFTAIVVAWMGRLKPLPIAGFGLFVAVLIQGCAYLQISMGISHFMANVIQAIILFFILGSDFFINYRIAFRRAGEVTA
ncbi:MAG: ABC transporter permease [Clostridiales Family XIII bacterium]|jgi:simple sugar transport system permease protein|nr:ABC transporter permease [Clostridiales Family XIII bacterium]